MREIETVIRDTTFAEIFEKYWSITRSVFKYRLSCTRRAFEWRIAVIYSWRERNRFRILYRPSTNCKMIRAVVSASPAIFLRNQRMERHLYKSVIQILHSIMLKIRKVRFLICFCLETTPIYRGLHLEIWKNQWILILYNFSENSFHFCFWCYRHF